MSFFPRSILLATDGSDEAKLAAQAATELSKETASQVHVVYTLPTPAQLIGHHFYSDEIRESLIGGLRGRRDVPQRAGGEDRGGRREDSGNPPQEQRPGQGDPPHSRAAQRGHDSDRQPRLGRDKQGAAGQRLRLGCTPRSLPGVRSARGQDKRLTTCRALKSWCKGPTKTAPNALTADH